MHCLSFPGHCAFQLHTAWILVHSWHPAAFLFVLFLFASHPGRVLSLLSFTFLSLPLPLCYAEPRDSFLDTAAFWTAIRLDGTRNWKHFARIKKNVPRNCLVASGILVFFGVGYLHFSRFRRTFAEKVTSVNRDIPSSRTVFMRRTHR